MRAVIIAGDSNSSLAGMQIPKCLSKINGRFILAHQIKLLKRFGISNISVIVRRYGLEWAPRNISKIRKICPNIIVNGRDDNKKFVHDILLAIRENNDDVIILNGGVMMFRDALEKLISFYNENSTLLTKDLEYHSYDYSFVYTKFHKVLEIGRFTYSPKATAFSGTFKIVSKDIKYIKKIIDDGVFQVDKLINKLCKIRDIYEYRTTKWKD